MVLPGATFSDDVQKRIKNFPIVADSSILPDSDLYVEQIQALPAIKGKPQAVPIPGSKEQGYSPVYRSVHCPDRLVSTPHPKITTYTQAFEASVRNHPNNPCLGERTFNQTTKKWGNYEYSTYSQVRTTALNISSGIINVVEKHVNGLEPHTQQYTVGLYGPNSRNWVTTDLACAFTALTSVPLYDTLGPDATKYIINLTEMPIIFASLAHIPYLLSIKHMLPSLKVLVSFNEFEDQDMVQRPGHSKRDLLSKWAASVDVNLYTFKDIEESGKAAPRELRELVPEDIQSLCFTSGTTGNPKGVIIPASSVVSAICLSKYHDAFMNGKSQVAYLSFLPLAHIYERLNIYSLLSVNSKVGFLHGEVTELFEDIAAFKPTLLAGVPRVWNKMAAAIKASTIEGPGVAGALSRKAFETKLQRLKETGQFNHMFWDFLWSNKIRRKLGFDHTKAFISGSAPLAGENIELLKAALAVDLLQGYGLTESLSGVSVCLSKDIGAGSVGPISPTTEIRLRSLPDMGYSGDEVPCPKGEIMLRGPQMFKGYYKNEEETKKAIDEDGWFHTGDVGMIDEYGRIFIIDRVKNMFKLAQGEYVGPERIESIYQSGSSLIAQIFVEGNSLETYLVSIVGILPEAYVTWLKHVFKQRVDPSDLDTIKETFGKKEVRMAFIKEINRDAQKAGLKGFEMVKNLALFIDPLTSDNGTLTPTLKVKRKEAATVYKDVIDALYKEGPLVESISKSSKL